MMGKLLSIFTLIVLVASPALECQGDFCAKDYAKSGMTSQNDSSDLGSQGDQTPIKDSGHCAIHCSHAPNVIFSRVTIQLPITTVKSHVVFYSFLYKNPPLESIERPPLAS